MRWLVTGAGGMLGQDLVPLLRAAGHDVTAAGRSELDLSSPDAADDVVAGHDVVVNCAAFTAVDLAEEQEAAAFTVNAAGPARLARAAHRAGARMVHLSTDYVFAGDASRPYGEDDPVAPRSAYGRTKAAGEWAVRAECDDHLVVRTAWLYGAHGRCFPRTIVAAARERGALTVVDDQVGQPTWTVDVARTILDLVTAGAPAGTYHATAEGSTTWWAFARAAVAAAGMDPAIVRPTTSEEFVRPAPRPSYSVLGHDRTVGAGVATVGDWQQRWQTAAATVLA